MGSCRCEPAALLHIRPDGVHRPDGTRGDLVVADEVWSDVAPVCSACGAEIDATFYRCAPCDAVICRTCVAVETLVVECDCELELQVTGVRQAALRAAAQLSR